MDYSTVDLGNLRLAVRAAGSGKPLICLHAIGHGARDFDRVAERLGERFRVVAPDWPGHGDSPASVTPDAAEYAALLPTLFDRLGIARALVLGNSIGGAAALRFAHAEPERVAGLVLCDAGGLVPVNFLTRFAIGRTARRFELGATGDPHFAKWYARYYAKMLRTSQADWRRGEIVGEGARLAPLLAEAWRRFARPEADLRALVPQLAMPVLVAWGRKDPAIPWLLARGAAISAKRGAVALFDCGHCPFIERPDEFDAALLAFTSDLPPD